MKKILLFLFSLPIHILVGQTIATFEDIPLESESFDIGINAGGSFTSGNISIPNDYQDLYGGIWSGWGISNTTDSLTQGFLNESSAIVGSGFEGSSNYAVSFSFGPNKLHLENGAQENGIEGLYVTNNSYAYYSMKDGDAFAKKFGGPTGQDPDFFLLTIKHFEDGVLQQDSIDFYLADYRSDDPIEDYIIEEWTYIDLSSFGKSDSLSFSLSSSDNGQFGMNTPAYFCLDQVETIDGTSSIIEIESNYQLGPNPVSEILNISSDYSGETSYKVYDQNMQVIGKGQFRQNGNIYFDKFNAGTYFIMLENQNKAVIRRIIKVK